ncbi:MAG: hypothetical protein QNJ74_29525 [Trichodesmium sp. MO_231.B1]|nr:hypothetical protein [Trichodesmium sp. MO_231.B1]
MTEHLTISNTPPEHPGMNFTLLREEGIKHIERLGGKIWTDYNTHDPGITILEQLCYAITDLSYRLDFEMKDLLAPPPGESRKQFYTAREILTVNPLTINDYRKLLIDIEGVKNTWLEPIKNSQPPIYYDPNRHTLTFEEREFTQSVNLNGLYRILIEKDKNIDDEANLIEKVESKLNEYRNLGEDFASVEILPIEEISIQAEIEVEEGFDVNELMAKIYFELDNFISPNLDFFSLKELLEQGKSPEVIFDGPPLEHGFLNDEQLESFTKKNELYTSDLIQIILDIEGIKIVRSIAISNKESPQPEEWEEWVLKLGSNFTPQLQDIDSLIANITFDKRQISCVPELDKVQSFLESLQQENTKLLSTTQIKDIPIPVGEYRELSDYESIQNDFPATYGIGEVGLPFSASPQRKAQAKQLQAYLMFFDQVLANYFAQLEHTKDLFNYQTKEKITYFSQELDGVPGASQIINSSLTLPGGDNEDLLPGGDIQDLLPGGDIQDLLPGDEDNPPLPLPGGDNVVKINLERKNRFLNHLMAQFAEIFTDYSLLLYSSIIEESFIDNKITFLQNYPQISSNRNQAFNCINSSEVWDTDNVSGLKQRICSLLGIPYDRRTLALSNQSDEKEGFHIVEHILLRPRHSNDPTHENPNFLNFGNPISEFRETGSEKIVTCVSPEHGILENELIQIFETDHYNGTYSVTNVEKDTFDIEIETGFVESEEGQWVEVNRIVDPYSFQISFVFPNWIDRFKNENFQQLIRNIVSAEIPAHITPYYHWFDWDKMKEFETAYTLWLNTIVDENSDPDIIKEATNNLIKELEVIGNIEITEFNVIGYMIIGTEDDPKYTDFIVS